MRKRKEYPKIIYKGGKSMRVNSEEEAIEVLGDKSLIDLMPGQKVEQQDKPEDGNTLRCKYCGRDYPWRSRRFLPEHEEKCEMNPANNVSEEIDDADRDGDSETDT